MPFETFCLGRLMVKVKLEGHVKVKLEGPINQLVIYAWISE